MKAITVGFPLVSHALGALRYLVAGIDAGYLARARKASPDEPPRAEKHPDPEALWTTIG